MPNYIQSQNDFNGVQAVVAFFSSTIPITQEKLNIIFNFNIRQQLSIYRSFPVAFVLDSSDGDQQSPAKLVMESFCAANNISFFHIDVNNSTQVVSVVEKLLNDINNQVGAIPQQPQRPASPPLYPQLNLVNTKTVDQASPNPIAPPPVLSLSNGQTFTAA